MRLLNLFCLLLLISSLFTCRQAEPEPDLLLDGTPRLTSISFSGIPQANISIDQNKKIIMVQMPTVIPDNITTRVELTDNAEWVYPETPIIGGKLFGCESCFHIYLKDKRVNIKNSDLIDYTVKPIASAPLKVNVLTSPLSYTIHESYILNIPMLNLYGSALPKAAQLTHDGTGETIRVERDSTASKSYHRLNGVHFSLTANQLGIKLWQLPLLPGSYQINLLLDDGTTVKIPQPLVVKKGSPSMDWEPNQGPPVIPRGTLSVTGTNLFEGDVRVALIDSADQVTNLPNVTFDRYGRSFKVQIPASVRYGHYVFRLTSSGAEPTQSCHRLHIKSRPNAPFEIITLGDGLAACSIKGPVFIRRNELWGVTTEASNKKARFRLIPIDDATRSYFAKAVLYSYANFQGLPTIFVTNDVPVGTYKVTLQILNNNENIEYESLPFWRDVVIQ